MENKLKINTFDLLMVFSNALDLISPLVSGHQIRVAYIALMLAKQYKLPKDRIDKLVIAATIHDIGATTVKERNEIINPDFESDGVHEKVGFRYVNGSVFDDCALIIRHHHRNWDYGNGKIYDGYEVPLECQILHLADRVETYINKSEYILKQRDEIVSKIKGKSGNTFIPELVDAFVELSVNESFWLYTVSKNVSDVLFEEANLDSMQLDVDELYEVTRWFANIIDFRSRFTAVHSRGVSTSAGAIATVMNLDKEFVKILEIAGFLHDLGKLAVSNTILEKDGKLDADEIAIIRSHTFHTYNVLSRIKEKEFHNIIEYAAYHHEKLNGTGYPFHIKGDQMKLGSRIMAVADVFTAIAEDRPYRKAMNKDQVIDVMTKIGDDQYLDSSIVKVLLENYDTIDKKMKNAQILSRQEYEKFWQEV